MVVLRGEPILLDVDLAELYDVSVKQLNQAVKRNRQRFPPDFVFQLAQAEWTSLRSQSVTSNPRRGGRRYAPYAFTEHGAVMVATVLNSPRAVALSVLVVRAFVRLRGLIASHETLARRLDELERRYDGQFEVVFQAIREILNPPSRPPRRPRITHTSGHDTCRVVPPVTLLSGACLGMLYNVYNGMLYREYNMTAVPA